MAFELVKSLEGVSFYGNIPESFGAPEGSFEKYRIEESDVLLLNEDFVDSVNDACGTLLDYGDIDFFDAEKCKALKNWLVARLNRDCEDRLAELYGKLLDYAEQAIDLDTGIVVEL